MSMRYPLQYPQLTIRTLGRDLGLGSAFSTESGWVTPVVTDSAVVSAAESDDPSSAVALNVTVRPDARAVPVVSATSRLLKLSSALTGSDEPGSPSADTLATRTRETR